MREYMINFMNRFEYPEEAKDSIMNGFDKIQDRQEEQFKEILSVYENDEKCDCEIMLDKMSLISEKCSIHKFQGHLILMICMSAHLKELYDENGYTEKMWEDAMADLKYKLLECHDVKKVWGIFVASWEKGFFDLTRFSFGRLQFEVRPFEGSSCVKGQIEIQKDDPVVEVHIPRTQTPLKKEWCQESYEKAYEFFKPKFGEEPLVFVMYSWILYPGYQDIFPENSNIRKFNEDYTVLFTTEDESLNENMWRLFDMDWTGDVNDYPEDSTLRKRMKEYLLNGKKVGSAYAIYIPDMGK